MCVRCGRPAAIRKGALVHARRMILDESPDTRRSAIVRDVCGVVLPALRFKGGRKLRFHPSYETASSGSLHRENVRAIGLPSRLCQPVVSVLVFP